MNPVHRLKIVRLISLSIVLLLGYILILAYIRSIVASDIFEEIAIFTTVMSIGLLLLLWYRERNFYFDHLLDNKIQAGQAQYLLCPNCQVIQKKGLRQCATCNEEWILCKVCDVPFESGSQVLISPCCGQGFHYDHFEAALRQFSHCPYCGSDLALETANW